MVGTDRTSPVAEPTPRRPPVATDRPPRRLRHGLKLRGREEPRVSGELAERWLAEVLAGVSDAEESVEGLKYARAGQCASLEIAAGGVTARVQGHRGRPYVVTIPVPQWSLASRDAVVAAMAGEAASLAALLDGLLPTRLEPTCECSRPRTCRHALSVGMLVAERLAEDPLLVLAMRDLPAERLLDRLRQQRALESRGLVTAHPEPDVPEAREEPAALGAAAAFWRPAARRSELAAGLPRDAQDHALLRRLGASPLGGQFPLVGLLASIYDTIREDVRRGEAAAEAAADEAAWDESADGPDAEPPRDAPDDLSAVTEPAAGAAGTTPAPRARAMPKAKARARAKATRSDGGDGSTG
ncbi:MAG: SWIM zinc finger family protein [Planctomycetota bacterium]